MSRRSETGLVPGFHFANHDLPCRQTCKKLRNLISKSSTLQLHIELEANNFEIRESASRIGLRSAELLERLKRVRDSESSSVLLVLVFLSF